MMLFLFVLPSFRVEFCAVGDVLLDRGIRTLIKKHGVDYPFSRVSDVISRNDLAFCNLECPICTGGVPLNKKYCFHADTSFIFGLKNAGFNVISVANNHTMDRGREGFVETVRLLKKHGFYPVGGGENQKEARKPVIVECNGLRFAFFAYVNMLLEGVTYLDDRPSPAMGNLEEMEKEIRKIRDEVDFVVVSFHWGIEYQDFPTINQIEYAHRAIDAGADLVLGHHPHVLQGIEYYRERPIVYSLGNFVFDQRKLVQRQSMIFGCVFKKGKIDSVYFIPVILKGFRPEVAKGKEREEIVKRMEKICKGFNVRFLKEKERVRVVDTTGKNSFITPICRLRYKKGEIIALRKRIIVKDTSSRVIDSFLLDTLEVKDCCGLADSHGVRLYGILGKENESRGERIVIFPVYEGKVYGPLLDVHRLNPWKITIAEIDGEYPPELCVGVWKMTRYDKRYANRLFVYNIYGDYIYPKWFGSRFRRDFMDFEFSDVNGDGVDELILKEIYGDSIEKEIYKWDTFGFIPFSP